MCLKRNNITGSDKSKRSHITEADRYKIEALLKLKMSRRKIAKEPGKSRTAINN
jgi:IS30 family transposase